jgi:ABC-type nitrate/sulfonate/bicarbonate transport system substrate-binding protein
VTLNGGGPEFPEVQMVSSGADQFGTTWADTLFIARENGINLVSLATLFQTSPSAYMVHADADINEPADFAGKTVGVFYGGGIESEYRALLQSEGVDRSQIDEVPGEVSLEPFLSRRVDVWPVYATDQPNTVREMGVDIDLIYARDYGIVMIGDTLFATEEFVAQNPNTTQAFVSASLRGWQWAIANPDAAIELVHNYNPEIDIEQLRFEAEQTIPLLTYGAGATCVGYNDSAVWEAERELLVDLEVIAGNVTVDEVMTNRFVDAFYATQGVTCESVD